MGAVMARIRKWQRTLHTIFLKGDGFVVVLIVLVGFASFGLGRLSVRDEQAEPISIEYFSERTQTASAVSSDDTASDTGVSGEVVASKTGSKYHYPWCGGASQIKEENKIWFASIEEARKAGYTPAANCKGLK